MTQSFYNIDDLELAGGLQVRRREWAVLQSQIALKRKPEKLSRFLNVKFEVEHERTRKTVLWISQSGCAQKQLSKYDAGAQRPAGR